MRFLAAVLSASILAAAGCQSPAPPERRHVSLSWEPHVDVICELRAYRIDEQLYGQKEFAALQKTRTEDLRFHVRGFLWEIIGPKQFAGKALSLHFDGPLASGDPFEAFTFGRRYAIKVSKSCIGNDRFVLCY